MLQGALESIRVYCQDARATTCCAAHDRTTIKAIGGKLLSGIYAAMRNETRMTQACQHISKRTSNVLMTVKKTQLKNGAHIS